MKVKAEHIPADEVKHYLTEGKVYEMEKADKVGGIITSDNGGRTVICFTDCSHLDGGDWTIVE